MNLIGSFILGREGTYHLGNITIKFEKSNPTVSSSNNRVYKAIESAYKLANNCSYIFVLGHVNTFVHEMGHALALLILGEKSHFEILIYSDGSGSNRGIFLKKFSSISQTIILLAGPLARAAFCTGQIFAIFALRHRISPYLRDWLYLTAIVNLVEEHIYAFFSPGTKNGDFERIKKLGLVYYSTSAVALLGVSLLGFRKFYEGISTLR